MNCEANIRAREEATAAFLLLTEAANALPEDQRQRFWLALYRRVGEVVGTQRPQDPKVLPMSETEAVQFERTCMPWGKYKGLWVKDIDLDYLFFIAEKADPFMDNLRRYLRSDRVQQEQDELE